MKTPFDLMVAPNGARLTKADHPAVPLTPRDLAQTAAGCAEAGATAIHVHVRDDDGRHSIDPDRYLEVTAQISQRASLHIQISTEAAGIFDVDAQVHCLKNVVATDASVSLRELSRDPDALPANYQMAAQRGISIQHILYSEDEVSELLARFDDGDIPEQSRRAIFVLGRYATDQRSTPSDLDPFLSQLGENKLNWSVCAFGPREQDCLLSALAHGGNVRVGFENNMMAPNGSIFPNNEASVASFVAAAEKMGFVPHRSA